MADTNDAMPKFAFKEVVFAKIRGYVPWPAIVDGVRGHGENIKYDVFFYGTNQLGLCKEEDLKPYVDNRATLGKPKKHIKFFNKAVQEADDVLGLPCQNNTENESGSSKIGKKRGRSRSKTRSRSVSPDAYDTNAKRGRPRTRSSSCSSKQEEESSHVKRRGRSRSRNKSMPRIGAESSLFEQSEMSESSINTDGSQTAKRKRGRPRSLSRSLPVDNVICGKTEPSLNVKQCIVNPDIDSAREKKAAYSFFDNETVLNNAVFGIQGSLSLMEKPDFESANKKIDEFFVIDLCPLLLKKHPDAVKTIEYLQYYCGNLEKWNFKDLAKTACLREMKKINKKARVIYNMFKELFKVPEGESFEDFFKEEVKRFRRATQRISEETVWKMTKDPEIFS